MIDPNRIAGDAFGFLKSCSALEATAQRARLCDLAVRRVIASLSAGNAGRLTNWCRRRDESFDEMADIVHAACHAVATGFERDDRPRLPDVLYALEFIECELTDAFGTGRCGHDHELGIPAEFSAIA
ncbi:MAG: hypothetical protein NVS2B17_14560 [Candidatus Velthaea sp.]